MSGTSIPAPVGRSLYFVSFLLAATPVLDLLSQALPAKPGVMIWRYGVLGLLGNQLLTPVLGFALAAATARVLGHGRTARAISIVSVLVVVALLAAAALFSLDALQLRSRVQPDGLKGFDVGAAVALLKYGLAAVSFGLTAAVGLRSGSPARAAELHSRGRSAAVTRPASVLVR